MIGSDPFTNYLDLLKIRQSARRRDALIIGAGFLVSFIGTIAFGLVSGLGNREAYLLAVLNVAFGAGFVSAWVRLAIVNENIDLLNNLKSWNDEARFR